MAAQKRKSLGESLVEEGIITADQLKDARSEEKGVPIKDLIRFYVALNMINLMWLSMARIVL